MGAHRLVYRSKDKVLCNSNNDEFNITNYMKLWQTTSVVSIAHKVTQCKCVFVWTKGKNKTLTKVNQISGIQMFVKFWKKQKCHQNESSRNDIEISKLSAFYWPWFISSINSTKNAWVFTDLFKTKRKQQQKNTQRTLTMTIQRRRKGLNMDIDKSTNKKQQPYTHNLYIYVFIELASPLEALVKLTCLALLFSSIQTNDEQDKAQWKNKLFDY